MKEKEIQEPKNNATYTIGWHIGSEKYHEKSAYLLIEQYNKEFTIIDFKDSRESLKEKVEHIAKLYNAKILTQH